MWLRGRGPTHMQRVGTDTWKRVAGGAIQGWGGGAAAVGTVIAWRGLGLPQTHTR